MGTKLRALYQLKKGRDLFDMQVASDRGNINIEKTLECYSKYRDFMVERAPTYTQFVQNMELKLQDPEFIDDTDILLRTGADKFDPQRAYAMVKNAFINKMPGKKYI